MKCKHWRQIIRSLQGGGGGRFTETRASASEREDQVEVVVVVVVVLAVTGLQHFPHAEARSCSRIFLLEQGGNSSSGMWQKVIQELKQPSDSGVSVHRETNVHLWCTEKVAHQEEGCFCSCVTVLDKSKKARHLLPYEGRCKGKLMEAQRDQRCSSWPLRLPFV